MKIAVVGAGLAGMTAARGLQRAGHQVNVFEKSRGPSGRMSTRRTDAWSADHGAQYFTARTPEFQAVVQDWIARGVAQPWKARIRALQNGQLEVSDSVTRYVGAPRMTSPVQAWAAEIAIETEQTVTVLRQSQQGGWQLQTKERGRLEPVFDAVVLAIPAPQVLAFAEVLPDDWRATLRGMTLLPCWAVMARYSSAIDLGFDGLFANDERVSWVSWNQTKPGRDPTPVAVIHATAAFTQDHLEADKEWVCHQLSEFLHQFGVGDPQEALAHRWLYALPGETHAEGASALWSDALGLGLCGDYLCGGRVEGAFLSGHGLVQRMGGIASAGSAPPF